MLNRFRPGAWGVLPLAVLVASGCGGSDPALAEDRGEPKTVALPTGEIRERTPAPEVELPEVLEPVEARVVTYEEAESVFRERRYDEAVGLFTTYTEQRPDNPWGHYMLGLSARRNGQSAAAVGAFERALELDPDHVKSLLNLARALLDEGRADDALTHVDRALELDTTSSDGFRLLGLASHALGDVDGAINAYEQAIIYDDRDVWSMNNLGLLLIQQEQFESALYPLALATELEPNVEVFQNNLGVALERTGHITESIDAYRAALVANEGHVKAAVNLDRVEALRDDTSVRPVDLGELARAFTSEILAWREAVAIEALTRLPTTSIGDQGTEGEAKDEAPAPVVESEEEPLDPPVVTAPDSVAPRPVTPDSIPQIRR